jgi:hypothetical protein
MSDEDKPWRAPDAKQMTFNEMAARAQYEWERAEATEVEAFANSKEIERLNVALKWEQHRTGRMGTHSAECHTWGPQHYECLLREYNRITALLAEKDAEIATWMTRCAAAVSLVPDGVRTAELKTAAHVIRDAALDEAAECCEELVVTADNDVEEAFDQALCDAATAILALKTPEQL